jgi:hypothetical protein
MTTSLAARLAVDEDAIRSPWDVQPFSEHVVVARPAGDCHEFFISLLGWHLRVHPSPTKGNEDG